MVILLVVLLFLAALFTGIETAFICVSPAKLQALKKEGNKRAEILLGLIENKDQQERVISAFVLGFTFVSIGASTIATVMVTEELGSTGMAITIATGLMSTIIIIFCEVLPKTLAVRNPEKLALINARLCRLAIKIIFPVVWFIQKIVDATLFIFGISSSRKTSFAAMDVIRGEIELHHEKGEVVSEDKHMLGGVLDLGKVTVEEIMVHRKDVKSISLDDKVEEVVNRIISSQYSRLPVWRDNPDNIIGIIYIRDIMKILKEKDYNEIKLEEIEAILKKPKFVPNTTMLKAQLKAFRESHTHMAIVVDEYGDLEGIVTLEDIVEEVVGQIEDEYDILQKKIGKNRDGSFTVQGEVTIRDFNRETDWNLPDITAITIGGLLFHTAKGVPEIGDSFKVDEYKLKLIQKKGNKLLKVRVFKNIRRPKGE